MADEDDKGIVRVKVVPEDLEHSTSGRWSRFVRSLRGLFKRAVDEDLAASAVQAAKSKLDEQSIRNDHVSAQIEHELAESRFRHSETDKSLSFIDSERRLLDAQAEKTEAEAAKIREEAQSARIANQLKILEQFKESGLKLTPVLDEDGNLVSVKVSGTRQPDDVSAPRRITLKRKSESELRLAGSQGRSRTVNVEVRRKRTYTRRDVLEEQARQKQAELETERLRELAKKAEHPEHQTVQGTIIDPEGSAIASNIDPKKKRDKEKTEKD